MDNVKLKLNRLNEGRLYLDEGSRQVAEMIISVAGSDMTVYHTEVSPGFEGKGLAKKLFDAMVDYARQHSLKVISLCPFASAMFKRHPNEYADIWKK